MNGEEITFIAGGQTYNGKVKGNGSRGRSRRRAVHVALERDKTVTLKNQKLEIDKRYCDEFFDRDV